jgi:hypothetical protein
MDSFMLRDLLTISSIETSGEFQPKESAILACLGTAQVTYLVQHESRVGAIASIEFPLLKRC